MKKEFLRYAIPSALSMFVSSLYTVIDGMFVGQGVGDLALAAVNIDLPFVVMLFGITNMFAIGGGALVSKNIGAKQIDKAVEIFRKVFKLLLIISIVTSGVCVIFANPIVKMLGATESLEGLSAEYLRYYAIFCIPNLIGISLNSFVRNDGRPKLAMISMIAGAITNIILDYIFIFQLRLGIKGAAIATGLGQIVTVAILLTHFFRKQGYLTFGNVELDLKTVREFASIGLPSFFAQISYSIIVLANNMAISRIAGEVGLSTYSIINYINTNLYMILLGLTLGTQPLVSYNYGKKDSEKMLGFYKINCIASMIISMVFLSLCVLFGKFMIGIFSKDLQIIELGYGALIIVISSYIMVGLNLNTIVYYQAIEYPKFSNIICALRSIIILPICLVVLGNLFGMNGIWISTIFTEFLTFVSISLIANIRKYTLKVVTL
ncbi:MAG: MATE family efflux transporter [Anaeromicrobium sp.]|jgi:putative MATE family efflux protein|uniref:MATE family efflux transporter n=1 Tax=Anaeromicrobium sp. TaxID=1929132 RepID=UPI0025EED47C|nr:MATE family efflux transporter [Anaeromicrobium sp.]MCT4594021.1 MATE family efflux transporter [Anaeromicrobium sp.]